ncbi:MAG: ribonuclease H family protein [Clostridiales bacterium]|nr:ribonuclease H family protein [Clostridiales bacterium]
MKVYAVRKGNKTGIFNSWADCQAATKGFHGAEFKSFKTREEAEAYLDDRDIWIERVTEDIQNGYLVAFTDGSFEKKLKRYSYGVYFILPDGAEDSISGYEDDSEFMESHNIAGEVFGVIRALDLAITHGYKNVKIYHDYIGLSKWISGEWTAGAPISQMFVNIYNAKYRNVMQVEFVKVPAHSNVIYNEKADRLAKACLKQLGN